MIFFFLIENEILLEEKKGVQMRIRKTIKQTTNRAPKECQKSNHISNKINNLKTIIKNCSIPTRYTNA